MYRWLAQLQKALENELFRWKFLERHVILCITKGFSLWTHLRKHRYLLRFYKGNPFIMQIMHPHFGRRDLLLGRGLHLIGPFSKAFWSWASHRYIFPSALAGSCRYPRGLWRNTSGIWSEYPSEYFFLDVRMWFLSKKHLMESSL